MFIDSNKPSLSTNKWCWVKLELLNEMFWYLNGFWALFFLLKTGSILNIFLKIFYKKKFEMIYEKFYECFKLQVLIKNNQKKTSIFLKLFN